MALKTPHFKFLDIRSYLAPNYSYADFIKAYKCTLAKGFFPYDYLNYKNIYSLKNQSGHALEHFANLKIYDPLVEIIYRLCKIENIVIY